MKYIQSIRFKLMMLVVIPLFVIAALYIGISMFTSAQQVNENNVRISESTEQTVLAIIEEWRVSTLGYAKMIADQPTGEMVHAIRSKDTDAIIALAKSTFDYSGCDGMTFADIEGNALARVTNPAKFGDNIKTSLAIADAMAGKSVSYAYPTSNNGFSITAGVPIMYSGEQIGVLFLSKRLDNEKTLQSIKTMIGCDVVLYQHDQPLFMSFENEDERFTEALDPDTWSKISASTGNGFTVLEKIDGNDTVQRLIPISGKDGAIVGAIRTVNAQEKNNWVTIMWIIVFAVSAAILLPIVILSLKKLVRPILALSNHAGKLAVGDMSSDIEKTRNDELGLLQGSMYEMTQAMRDQSNVIGQIASGNFTVSYSPRSNQDSVGNSLVDMIEKNHSVFSEIHHSAEQVSTGAHQVADGAQALSQGATEQAATVEELSAAISTITEKTKLNPAKPGQAAQLADTIRVKAEKGTEQMDTMISAVKEIHEVSQSIGKVMKTIDDIAFQTNILALNAAVEAARAGQHGKGFAVVAEEVRNLAAKSAEAAKETESMIVNSIEKAELGVRIAGETSNSLAEIVAGVNESSHLISDIAKETEAQSLGISKINTGIDQVAQVVQQISVTAQESAAVSEEMSSQSTMLRELVAQFKIKDNNEIYEIQRSGNTARKRLAASNEAGFAITGSSQGN